METRLIIAYGIIAIMVSAFAVLALRYRAHRGREKKRLHDPR